MTKSKPHNFYTLRGRRAFRSSREKWITEVGHRQVAYTEFANKRVSTVFLGLNHSFGFTVKPMIFETMVFPMNSNLEEYCKRYSTWGQAERGHWLAVWKTLDSGDLSD